MIDYNMDRISMNIILKILFEDECCRCKKIIQENILKDNEKER